MFLKNYKWVAKVMNIISLQYTSNLTLAALGLVKTLVQDNKTFTLFAKLSPNIADFLLMVLGIKTDKAIVQ